MVIIRQCTAGPAHKKHYSLEYTVFHTTVHIHIHMIDITMTNFSFSRPSIFKSMNIEKGHFVLLESYQNSAQTNRSALPISFLFFMIELKYLN